MKENPYLPPATEMEATGSGPKLRGADYFYRPAWSLVLATGIFAFLSVALGGVIAAIDGFCLATGFDYGSDNEIPTLSEIVVGLIALGMFVSGLVWDILFLLTTFRLGANTYALASTKPRWTPGMAAIAYIVPIVQLLWPYKAMRSYYHASEVAPSILLNGWWALYLICLALRAAFASFFVAYMVTDSGIDEEFFGDAESLVEVIGLPFWIALALISQWVLYRLERKHDSLVRHHPNKHQGVAQAATLPPMRFSTWGGD